MGPRPLLSRCTPGCTDTCSGRVTAWLCGPAWWSAGVASAPAVVGRRGPWGWEEVRASHGEEKEKARLGERGPAALDIGANFTGRRVWRGWEARGVWGAVMRREDPCPRFGRHRHRHSCFPLTPTPQLLEYFLPGLLWQPVLAPTLGLIPRAWPPGHASAAAGPQQSPLPTRKRRPAVCPTAEECQASFPR